MTRRIILFAAACVIPGGFVIGAGVLAWRYAKRKRARKEIETEIRARVGWNQKWGEA